ncbi:MAG TPA: extracellular solute-binding protein [Limnochordia bacterium]|nr:extracellular solute-binding protein [Limnochordia bacterium]
MPKLRLVALATAAALPLALGVASADKAKVVIADYFTSGTNFDVMDGLVKAFAAQNPDLDVVHQTYPYNDLVSGKMLTLLLNNEAPTVFLMPNVYSLDYAGRGFLQDLSGMIKTSAWVHQDFIQPVIDSNKGALGEIWGIPQGMQMVAVYINTTMLSNAGLSYPDVGWTWDNFADMAKKMTQKDAAGKVSVFGASMTPGYAYAGWSMYRSLGGQAFSDNGRKSAIDNQHMIDTIQYIHDGVQSGYFQDSGDAGLVKEAMAPMQYWDVTALKQAKVPFDVAPLPNGPNGRFAPTVANSWVMTKSAAPAAQQAAWRWIEFYSDLGPQVKWALEGDAAPANSRAASQVFNKANTDPAHLKVFVQEMNNVDWIGNNPMWNDWFFTALGKNLDLGVKGTKSVLEAVKTADHAAQVMLDDYYAKQG